MTFGILFAALRAKTAGMRKINLIIIIVALLFCSEGLSAQLAELPILHDSLYSEILKEERGFDIVLPDKYNPASPEKYEMIYVMDAEWSTRIVSNIHQFLAIDFMPFNIIVGVNNRPSGKESMRGRDFTPTKEAGNMQSGGADLFLAFLKNELVPYINKKYKSSGVNTYCGSSLGGLFGMYAMMKEPHLFSSWLLADPSFWWDHGFMMKMAAEHLNDLKDIPLTLLITGRAGEPFQEMGTADMDSILKAKAPPSLHWQVNKYTGETHNAMIFRTAYDGLKFTYAGFSREPLFFYPMNGIVVPGKAVTLVFPNDPLKQVRYTIDGSAPSMNSKLVTKKVILSEPARVTVTTFCYRQRYNKTDSGNFVAGSTFMPAAKMKNAKPGGFHYDYYEGTWDSLPDFKKIKPVLSGIASKDFDLGKLPRHQNFALVQEGQLEVQAEGYYVFAIDCDGGAKLFLGGKLLLDYNGYHADGKFQTFVVPLTKGFYPVKLEYFQTKGNPSLNVVYVKPGEENADPLPLELSYSRQ
jgi:predicted alpha/beta superfamily hydrolase